MRLPTITNNSDISLEMAVWLLHDDYDWVKETNYISATGLMKPLRHIILPKRIPEGEQIQPDVEDYIATAMGQSLHAGIEKAWSGGRHVLALQKLGYPQDVIDRVKVNPTPIQLTTDTIPVYIEQRSIREITVNGITFKVGGKFDMVCDGRVGDTKSCSVWNWIYGSNEENYRLQGSIYRWLNPAKITEEHMRVHFIFTDWSKFDAKIKPNYPQRRVLHKDIPLMSLAETEHWIRSKLQQILMSQELPEKQLPRCTDEELWMSPPKHKYYSDPAKAFGGNGRSTKNFDDLLEAQAHLAEKGKGTVITVPGSPKRCGYCPAFPVCRQKDEYSHD